MDEWEYLTEVVFSSTKDKDTKAFLEERWPGEKPGIFSPRALIPQLNERGKLGWELVSIENVQLGGNADIGHGTTPGSWSNAYLAVFKRRVRSGG